MSPKSYAAYEPSTVTRSHVLVADDRQENVDLLKDALEAEGHRVTTASNGAEALARAAAESPDLILLDVDMPRMDGVEACRRLKADPATRLVPVILVTGLSARADRIRGMDAGCDDFFTKPVDLEQLLTRTRSALRTKALVDDLEAAENVLVSLAKAIDAKDPYTGGHSERVADFAFALGKAAGIQEEDCRNLRRAGLLHDIGKIGVPLEYIRKPGRLTTEEYEIVKQHSVAGYEICKPLRTMAPLLPLIRGHHERLDGGGYPDGLRGGEISLAQRCLTVADIYDALTSERPYRKALTREAALVIMKEEAQMGMWDSALVDLLGKLDLVQDVGAGGASRP